MADSTFTLWFSAPFRTPLSLDSPALLEYPALTASVLGAAAMRLASELDAEVHSPWVRNAGATGVRFRSLEDDSDQQFVSALLEVRGQAALAARLGDATRASFIAGDAESPRLAFEVDPRLVRLSLFDNTVAVLEWAVAIRGPDELLASLLSGDGQCASLDLASFAATAEGVGHAQTLVSTAIDALDEAFRQAGAATAPDAAPARGAALRMTRAVLRPDRFRVFIDVRERLGHARTLRAWPADGDDDHGLLWVSRVLFAGHETAGRLRGAIAAWSGVDLDEGGAPGAVRLLPRVGNSVVLGTADPASQPDLRASYLKLQYVYSLVDIHGRNITSLYSQFLARQQKVAGRTLASLNAIQSHIDYIDMQLVDVFGGLQGGRRTHVRSLREAWGMERKLEDLRRKSDAARHRMEGLLRTRSFRYQRMMQFILGAVGVLALADLLINLAWFSNSEEASPDRAWGLVAAVRTAAPDSFLTFSVLGLVGLLFFFGVLSRRG